MAEIRINIYFHFVDNSVALHEVPAMVSRHLAREREASVSIQNDHYVPPGDPVSPVQNGHPPLTR